MAAARRHAPLHDGTLSTMEPSPEAPSLRHQSHQDDSYTTIVRLCGSSRSSCGYCRGKRAFVVGRSEQDCSKAYGLLVSQISSQEYETLLYRGWRRSGSHLYKPDNFASCCPALTIRLPVSEFQPTKSQRKVWNRMQHALERPKKSQQQAESSNGSKKRARKQYHNSNGLRGSLILGDLIESEVLEELQRQTRRCMHALVTEPTLRSQLDDIPVKFKIHSDVIEQQRCVVLATTICAAVAGVSKGELDRTKLSLELTKRLRSLYQIDHNGDMGNGPRSSSVASVVDIRGHGASGQVLVTVRESLSASSSTMDTTNSTAADKSNHNISEDKIGQWLHIRHGVDLSATKSLHCPYSLKVKMVPALESALQPDVHRLYFLYQHKVHGDPDVLSPPSKDKSNTKDSNPLEENEEIEPEDWGEATEDWIVHAKSMLMDCYGPDREAPIAEFISFYKFLVESPLTSEPSKSRLSTGTYHQQYRIEGKLIAVGVVDVLPNGLSSVYAFYDPDFAHNICALGKYTSLYEIRFVKELGLSYYYMGYYIESCPKMTYKADYRPSQLLCPTHYVWVDAGEARNTLRKESPERHCCALYLPGGTEAKKPSPAELDDALQRIPLNIGADSTVTYDMLNQRGQEIIRPLLEEFIEHVGIEVSPRCVVLLV